MAAVVTDMLERLLGYQLRQAQARTFAHFMTTMASDKITPGQFGVLSLIEGNPGLTQSALATALGIERSTMVGVISALEKRKLVKRGRAATDRRSYALSLTAKGRSRQERVKAKVDSHEQAITGNLDKNEKQLLRELLKKIG
ncbi:MAG TPA: MarR family transcriptional regulator [Rhodospirillales bacterium]|nr:MarR family transcriptional regulator [Rhodospirillales bacterium]